MLTNLQFCYLVSYEARPKFLGDVINNRNRKRPKKLRILCKTSKNRIYIDVLFLCLDSPAIFKVQYHPNQTAQGLIILFNFKCFEIG